MTTLRERFQKQARFGFKKIVTILWDEPLTIEDIIYASNHVGTRARISSTFDCYFVACEPNVSLLGLAQFDEFRVCENVGNADKKLLLFVIMRGFECPRSHIYYQLYGEDSWLNGKCYEFQPGFLEECWELALKYGAEHKTFGNALKNLGLAIARDSVNFDKLYLEQ